MSKSNYRRILLKLSGEALAGGLASGIQPSAIAQIAAREQTQKQLAMVGSEAVGSTPEQFAATLRAERARWGDIVRSSGARLD